MFLQTNYLENLLCHSQNYYSILKEENNYDMKFDVTNAKYLIRSTFRTTPFGLGSAVLEGEFKNNDDKKIMNSILEAIFHETPMLATPMTSEMRLNGLIIQKIGIGYTIYDFTDDHKSIDMLLNELLYKQSIKKNLSNYSKFIKNNHNNWDSMWRYIQRVCNENESI